MGGSYSDWFQNRTDVFFKNRVVSRLQQLTEIADKYGKPWYIKIGAQSGQSTTLNEYWFQHY